MVADDDILRIALRCHDLWDQFTKFFLLFRETRLFKSILLGKCSERLTVAKFLYPSLGYIITKMYLGDGTF